MKKIKDFIEIYKPEAMMAARTTAVPWLLVLAMAALETGWGKSVKGFNFFGIKASKEYEGKKQKLKTKEVENGKTKSIEAEFRVYDTPAECFTDFIKVIESRFPNALKHNDPVDFITSVQKEHKYIYATDPEYIDKIAAVIRTLKQNGA